ncbi:MAG: cyclic pyranopterin monophosphate synthase MoaC [Desulfobacterota bacterium]|nr:cyclic pyranopterin monophosphate synthase MoaC [Thermodesulfobacteriota bacterium]
MQHHNHSNHQLTHFDTAGRSRMVDVSEKPETLREATAAAVVHMNEETFRRIMDRTVEKGDVLAVAQIAGIMAAKKTGSLIPMCHPLPLTSVSMDFLPDAQRHCIEVRATVRLVGRTGVEMEALVAVATASLTIYDMCKAIDREITVTDLRLLSKRGGKSGVFQRR